MFADDVWTSSIFEDVVRPKITSCLDGINITVCAYGQTASGKTYTVRGTDEHPGLIPLCVKELFSQKDTLKKTRGICIKLSYMELYNEIINDLLNENNKNLEVRKDLKKGIYVDKLTEVLVSTEEEAIE